MHHPNPEEVDIYLRAGAHALDLFKKLRDLWPAKSPERAQIEEKIVEAEGALRLSEAQLAKALGFQLCHCALPPGLMLSQGFHPKHSGVEVFKCNKCNKQVPPEAHLAEIDANNRAYELYRQTKNDWMV